MYIYEFYLIFYIYIYVVLKLLGSEEGLVFGSWGDCILVFGDILYVYICTKKVRSPPLLSSLSSPYIQSIVNYYYYYYSYSYYSRELKLHSDLRRLSSSRHSMRWSFLQQNKLKGY